MDYNKKLEKMAEPVIEELKKTPEVKAIAFYGSIARGMADRHSDIDILCFWSKDPSVSKMKSIIKKVKGDSWYVNKKVSAFSLNSVDTGIWNKNLFEMKILLEKRFKKKDPTTESDIDIFIDGIKPVYDPYDLIGKFKKNTKYPSWLRKQNLGKIHAAAGALLNDNIESALLRKNYIWIDHSIDQGIDLILRTLYAMNNRYYSVSKWVFKDSEGFKIKPKNFNKKLIKIQNLNNREDLDNKLYLINMLIEDIYDIIRVKFKNEVKISPMRTFDERMECIKRIKKMMKR